MTFSDGVNITNCCLTLLWMLIAYVLFKLQAKTFQIQADTFKEQQKISLLENKKFLLSIRPQFIIASNSYVQYPIVFNDGVLFTVVIKIRLESNSATEITFASNSRFLIDAFKNVDIEYMQVGKENLIVDGLVKRDYLVHVIDAEIYFSDEIGTKYVQKLTGTFTHPQISPPTTLK